MKFKYIILICFIILCGLLCLYGVINLTLLETKLHPCYDNNNQIMLREKCIDKPYYNDYYDSIGYSIMGFSILVICIVLLTILDDEINPYLYIISFDLRNKNERRNKK